MQSNYWGDIYPRVSAPLVVKGNPQGGILPPFLWNCVLNSLLLELRSKSFYVQAYADDLAVLVTGADMLWIRGMAQKAINIAANWASEQELQFSSKKTEIVLFTHKRNPYLGSLSMNVWRVKRSALRLRLTGSVVQPMICYDLLTKEAIASNYLSFVVTSLLVSTTPQAEAGTAIHFPLSESSGRKWPANVGSTSADNSITSGSPVVACQKDRARIAVNRLGCTTYELL